MNEVNGNIVMDISEVSPVGFNSRYFNPTAKPYVVSRGKAKLYKLGILYFVLSMILVIVSTRLIPYEFSNNKKWMEILAWAPRFVSMGLVIMGILHLRKSHTIPPLLIFSNKGVKNKEKDMEWEHISRIYVEYSRRGDSTYNLCIEYKNDLCRIDIRKVDEFSEDVAYTLNKYFKKYGESENLKKI